MAARKDQDASARGRFFATTHWSVELAAGDRNSPEAPAALEKLCRTYWYPAYAFVRQQGFGADDAQDLTQMFFARLLERNDLATARPERGKFRCFLLASLRHFLANEWHWRRAKKRGGGATLIPLETCEAESRYRAEPTTNLDPEKLYERRWALALLDAVHARLREELSVSGNSGRFDLLMDLLPGGSTEFTYAEVGSRLGLTESAVKSQVFRFKRRYLKALRAEIAHTLSSPVGIDDEIRALMSALGG